MPKQGPTTLKQKKVKKATGISNARVSEFVVRMIKHETKASEYLGVVTHVLGAGRFEVKNLQNPSDLETVKLSKSLYINKRAATNNYVQVGVRLGSVVLVDGGMVTAVVKSSDYYKIKPLAGIAEKAANEEGFVFEKEVSGGTRKNRRH